jgi:hypothetical protein
MVISPWVLEAEGVLSRTVEGVEAVDCGKLTASRFKAIEG